MSKETKTVKVNGDGIDMSFTVSKDCKVDTRDGFLVIERYGDLIFGVDLKTVYSWSTENND